MNAIRRNGLAALVDLDGFNEHRLAHPGPGLGVLACMGFHREAGVSNQ